MTDAQIKHVEEVYFAHLLDEDDDVRPEGFEDGGFEEYVGLIEDMDAVNRHDVARGVHSNFAKSEAAEVLTWTNAGLKLAPHL